MMDETLTGNETYDEPSGDVEEIVDDIPQPSLVTANGLRYYAEDDITSWLSGFNTLVLKLDSIITELKSNIDYTLVDTINIGKNSTNGIILDFENFTFDNFKEIYLTTTMALSNSGNILVAVNNQTANSFTFKDYLKTGVTCVFSIIIKKSKVNNQNIECVVKVTEIASNQTSNKVTEYIAFNNVIERVENITSLKIQIGGGWSNSTDRFLKIYKK